MQNALRKSFFFQFTDLTRMRKIFAFVGPDVLRYFLFGTFIGIFLFAVELAFAFGLQAFLFVLGVMGAGSVQLPSWVPHENFEQVLFFLLGAGVVRASLQWGQQFTHAATLEAFNYLQRSRILRWAFFSESVSSSEATSLFAIKADNAGKAIMLVQAIVIQAIATVLLFVSISVISLRLTLLAMLLLAIFLFPLRKLDRKILNAGTGANREWDKINRHLLLSIKNLLLMQIYGTQDREESRSQRDLKVHRDHGISFARALGLKGAVPPLVGIAVICFISFVAKKNEVLQPAILLTYFYLFVRMVQNLAEILRSRSNFSFYWAPLIQTTEWWANHSSDGVRGKKIVRLEPDRLPKVSRPIGWKMQSLGFTYPNSTADVIRDLSLQIEGGKALIIIGQSGAGKSTLLNLLLGGLTATSGTVEVDFDGGGWKKLNDESRQALLHNIGYVGPESFLIEGTILENITYGLDRAPSDEELKAAISGSECQFVYELPQALGYHLTEQGQGLSAGQKQRLGLARALLRKPKALILDEATANLDSETESRLVEVLGELKGKMTIIGVTHRQALLRIADQVLRMGD